MAEDPSLFDAVDAASSDDWTRAGWQPAGAVPADEPETFTAKPKRTRKPAPPPVADRGELRAVAEDAHRRWAERIGQARNRIDKH